VNAYQQLQNPGIHSPVPSHGLLYQPTQATPQWPEPQPLASIFEAPERQMAELFAEHAALRSEVRRHYVLPADSSVITFLTGHRTLPPILLEAVPQLKACFGAQAVFALRAPIDDSGTQTLYAVVMWPGKMRDVRDALEKFDNRWWIQHSRKASGHLTFTYELV
jgi:hypothetical protein